MLLINWLKFVPSDQDIEQSLSRCKGIVHLRSLCQELVRSVLQDYSWDQRDDIVSLFDPSKSYQNTEMIAFPLVDLQGVRPETWRIGTIKSAKFVESPVQGQFQFITVDIDGKKKELAACIPGAQPWMINFPPADQESLDWIISDFTDTYYKEISEIIISAVNDGRIGGNIFGDQVVIGNNGPLIDLDEQYYLEEIFAELTLEKPWLTIEEVLDKLRNLDCFTQVSDDIAIFTLQQFLAYMGYCNLGESQWTTTDLYQQLNRELSRRMLVPVIRSKLARELGEDDSQDLDDYEQSELDVEGISTLSELGEEIEAEGPLPVEWIAPSAPIAMPTLATLHMLQGYFPLTRSLNRAFDPRHQLLLVHIQIVEGDALPFLVNRDERTIKAVDVSSIRSRFLDLGIPAGTHLWLEYQGWIKYRLAPRPLAVPKSVLCKLAYLDNGKLHIEEAEIEMRFEGEAQLFKAEMRFTDIEALFRDAELSGLSIFDSMVAAFETLSAFHPTGYVHYHDLFNMVFTQYRMCSPRSVVTELYTRPCFVPMGRGYFCLDLSRGIKRAVGTPVRSSTEGKGTKYVEDGGFWEQIAILTSRKLYTLDKKKPFEIVDVSQNKVELVVSTGEPRTLQRKELEEAWNRLVAHGELPRTEIRDEISKFSSSFVAAILAALPGVVHQQNPIRLFYQPTTELPTTSSAEVEEDGVTPLPPSLPVPTPQAPEKTRRGQFIAPGILPQGPLFDPPSAVGQTPSVSTELPSPGTTHPETGTTHPGSTPDRISSAHTPTRVQTPQRDQTEMQTKTLFSSHFLNNRLSNQPEWSEDAFPVLTQVRELWKKARQIGETWNEAQTEQEFIQPILEILGWSYIVQTKSRRNGQVTRPDYSLFADEASKHEAYSHQGDDKAFYSRVLAIAEAKHWGRPLSQKDSSGRATWKAESNPSHQMVSYLVGTRAEWGILTNGSTWRLYSREVSSTASEYYEINLGEIFDFLPEGVDPSPEQIDHFKRWWLFFRRSSFTRDTSATPFVQRIHEGSALYAQEISEKLKELVFKEVMPEIAGGFVAYRRHQLGIQEETAETLSEIYQASLSLLYKLLFLLYAEARSLLPMENPDYRSNSLTAMAQWAARQIDAGRNLSEATFATPRYDTLLALFRRVDRGDPALGIPHYNGGLFSPASPENCFLDKNKLSDRALAQAVDILVRDQGQPVDYAYISVRNLGAIYEGLLENRLEVMDASTGQVNLVNDKGERKATGSYYTPDYIVEYIVEHTIDPILEVRRTDFERAMGRVAELRKKLEKASDPSANRLLRSELEDAERQAREAFLGIKVLDPAMGSGHFLVNAVDHLTDGIILSMQTYHDAHPETLWEWDPIQQLIERVRSEIQAEMANQGLSVDTQRLDDTALLTRLVMKRCIYGVDLNRMAVELAKVSLWLHSFTVGAPLSFLDHHLRWGNSLIGADVRTVESGMHVQEQKGGVLQFNLFTGPFAGLLDLTSMMIEVAERADATLADVRQSTQAYENFQMALTPYKQVLDLWVSQYFTNKDALEFLTLFGKDVLPALQGKLQVSERYKQAIEKARFLWQEKRFFHWDLEFPEVFIDLQKRDWAEKGGFDAVIGNPPYDVLAEKERRESLSLLLKYFEASKTHSPALGRKLDLYRLFICTSENVVAKDGFVGLIVPMSLLADQQTSKLRSHLVKNYSLISIDAFPQKDDPRRRVFLEAKLAICILVVQKSGSLSSSTTLRVHPGNKLEEFSGSLVIDKQKLLTILEKVGSIPKVDSMPELHLLLRLHTSSELGTIGDILTTYQGEFNETTHQHLLVESPQSGMKIYRGGNVQRYDFTEVAKQGKVYFVNEEEFSKYQGTGKFEHVYLRRFGYQRKAALDNWKRLIFCELPQPSYCFESISYFLYEGEKSYFVLALLNSKLLEWRFSITSSNNMVSTSEISSLPVPIIKFVTPKDYRIKELARAQNLYTIEALDEVRALVNGWITELPNQMDIVHDLLAFLAQRMIGMNKLRRVETDGFLTWLERAIRKPIDSLAGKTILQNYLGDYQKGEPHISIEQILEVLRNNHTKLITDVSARVFLELLEKEYDSSLTKLLPIKEKLAATDRLIDQIVYALYGLTEEEIAIVEDRA